MQPHSLSSHVAPHEMNSPPCACGGGCPRCRQNDAAFSPANFPEVHVHPSAPEITGPLHARAVTLGQNIYFHPGQYRPETPEGGKLLAHELAHTLQTKHASVQSTGRSPDAVSHPGDALERNADALTAGTTEHALPAPIGLALRTPFDGESGDDRTRRESLIQSINHAEANLIRLLQTGGLVQGAEVAVQRAGTRGVVVPPETSGADNENFVTYSDRDAQIRRIIRNLVQMVTYYRSHPIPTSLPSAVLDADNAFFTTRVAVTAGTSYFTGRNPNWSQLQAAYELYRDGHGQTGEAYDTDWYYLEPNLTITPGAARGAPRIGGGIPTGVFMVFPDLAHEPLRYWRLTGFDPVPRGADIVEFWHDDIGYYYMTDGQRVDVPSPWSADQPHIP